MPKYAGVSTSVIRRLPRYHRFLGDLLQKGVERISSKEFAALIGLTASQIRQDLNCFGGFGQQGYGYNVASLYSEIGRILDVDNQQPTVLIGAGNLGLALAKHMNFNRRGFDLKGIFDNNPAIIGKHVQGITVQTIDTVAEFCGLNCINTAILCIPFAVAKDIVEILVQSGVKGFWNFSHYDIAKVYGKVVAVENVHLGESLMTLSYNISELGL